MGQDLGGERVIAWSRLKLVNIVKQSEPQKVLFDGIVQRTGLGFLYDAGETWALLHKSKVHIYFLPTLFRVHDICASKQSLTDPPPSPPP